MASNSETLFLDILKWLQFSVVLMVTSMPYFLPMSIELAFYSSIVAMQSEESHKK
jgi:magnesium-transporting ATPase (P-type)